MVVARGGKDAGCLTLVGVKRVVHKVGGLPESDEDENSEREDCREAL
jgi:hypothetical protein